MKDYRALVYFSLFLLAISLSSCLKDDARTYEDEQKELDEYLKTNNISTEPTWNGLYYIETQAGLGEHPEYYDSVTIKYTLSRLDGYELYNSEKDGGSTTFQLYDVSMVYGFNQAIELMKKGGKATAIVPSSLAYRNYELTNLPPYSTLKYDLELVDIIPGIPVEEYETEGLKPDTSSTGLLYYVIRSRTTEQVRRGKLVKLNYTGYLKSDHRIFDSSVKRHEADTFEIGMGKSIDGWDEGILLMREGEKYRLMIPPDLGYGDYGSFPVVPPYDTLIFDIELLKIL